MIIWPVSAIKLGTVVKSKCLGKLSYELIYRVPVLLHLPCVLAAQTPSPVFGVPFNCIKATVLRNRRWSIACKFSTGLAFDPLHLPHSLCFFLSRFIHASPSSRRQQVKFA
jgi:hypothetical protein